jgi:hypothetical protein
MARDKVGRSSEKGNERSKTTISDQPSRPPEGSIHHVTGGNQAVGASSNLCIILVLIFTSSNFFILFLYI